MKINIDKNKILNYLKKRLLPLVIIIFSLVLFECLYFAYKNVQSPTLNKSQIATREDKINEKKYNQIIENNTKKTNLNLDQFDNLINPFKP